MTMHDTSAYSVKIPGLRTGLSPLRSAQVLGALFRELSAEQLDPDLIGRLLEVAARSLFGDGIRIKAPEVKG